MYYVIAAKQVCWHFSFQLLYFELEDNGGLSLALQVCMCVASLSFLLVQMKKEDKVLLVTGLSPAILPSIWRQKCENKYFRAKFRSCWFGNLEGTAK